MSIEEIQRSHEAEIARVVSSLLGKSRESDWAVIRALVHRAVHVAADHHAGDYCRVSTLLAEMTIHAHAVHHDGTHGSSSIQ